MLLDECFANHPPRCWEKIIRRATSSIPERRYREVDDLIAAIKSRHRARTLSIAAAVLLSLSLAIFGGVYWWRMSVNETARQHSLRCAAAIERYNKFLKSAERERYDSNRIGNRVDRIRDCPAR